MSFPRFKQRENEKTELQAVCTACGRTIQSRKGSLTAWLFQEKYCTCNRSDAKPTETSTSNDPIATELIVDDPEPITKEERPNFGDRYEVMSQIGEGGMGTVFKVHDRLLGQDFAIKLLRTNLAANNAQARRFEQEAKTAKDLTHRNLVAVYDNGISSNGAPFIVMDYVDGKTLAQVIQEETFIPPQRAIDFFLQICDAVSHAHMKGVIHRDLKPSNILISTDNNLERARVTDFGIAKLFNDNSEATQLTQTGDVFGSPTYMSPEQGTGEPIDHRSDIYSLGCVMYETLSGKPPYAGTNPVKLIVKHLKEPVPPFGNNLAIPGALEAIVLRCLEKEKALRYQSVEELEHDLRLVQAGAKDLVHLRNISPRKTSNAEPKFGRVKIHPSVDSVYLLTISAFVLSGIFLLTLANVSTPTTGPAIALLLLEVACLLFWMGYCWIIKNEIVSASWLISSQQSDRISARLYRWPFGLIFEVPDEIHPSRQRKFIVNFQREYKKLLYATADNTIKDFRVLLDPQTKCPVALLLGDFTCTLLAVNQIRAIYKLVEPLSVFLRRIAATILDAALIAAPALMLCPVAPAISDALALKVDANTAISISTAIFMLTLVDGLLPCFILIFIYSMWSCAFNITNPIGVGTNTMVQDSPVARFWIVVCVIMIIWNFIYHCYFEASWRATPGKALLQLFISDKNGAKISIRRAILRHCARLGFSWIYLICWIGGLYLTTGLMGALNPYVILVFAPLVFILLSQRQQAPHDLVSSTLLNLKPGSALKATSLAGALIVGCVLAVINFRGFIKNDLGKNYLTACGIVPVQIQDVRLQKNPNDLKALDLRAETYFTSKQFDRARTNYELLTKLDPKNTRALEKLSHTLTELGDYKHARDSLDRLIATDTNELSNYYKRGLLDLYLGELKTAISDLERSRNNKQTGSAQDLERAIMEAFAFRALGNDRDAIAVIGDAIENSNALGTKLPNNARMPQIHMLRYLHREVSKDQLIFTDLFSDEFRCVIAIDLALSNKRAEALSALREVRRTSSKDAFGYRLAMVLLSRLESPAH